MAKTPKYKINILIVIFGRHSFLFNFSFISAFGKLLLGLVNERSVAYFTQLFSFLHLIFYSFELIIKWTPWFLWHKSFSIWLPTKLKLYRCFIISRNWQTDFSTHKWETMPYRFFFWGGGGIKLINKIINQ